MRRTCPALLPVLLALGAGAAAHVAGARVAVFERRFVEVPLDSLRLALITFSLGLLRSLLLVGGLHLVFLQTITELAQGQRCLQCSPKNKRRYVHVKCLNADFVHEIS